MRIFKALAISVSIWGFSPGVMADSLDRDALMSLDKGVSERIKDAEVFGNKNDIRDKSIQEKAFQVGAQYGYIKKIEEIQDALQERADEIDRIYNFPYLMSMSSDSSAEMYLIPPIVQKYSDIKALDHKNNSLTIIDNKYVITEPARLVTTPLDWRQYLTFIPEAQEIKVPDSLMPETSSEKSVWAHAVDEGWHEGEQLAEREMISRFEKLANDFGGIIRFNRLADEKYFTRPKLVETRTPVSGSKSELIQNKTVYTIVAESSANINDQEWEARVLDNRESMIFPKEYGSEIDIRVDTR